MSAMSTAPAQMRAKTTENAYVAPFSVGTTRLIVTERRRLMKSGPHRSPACVVRALLSLSLPFHILSLFPLSCSPSLSSVIFFISHILYPSSLLISRTHSHIPAHILSPHILSHVFSECGRMMKAVSFSLCIFDTILIKIV